MKIVVMLTNLFFSCRFNMCCGCYIDFVVVVIDLVHYQHHNDSIHAYTIAVDVRYLVCVYWSTCWCRHRGASSHHCYYYYHLINNLTSCWYAMRLVTCLCYSHFQCYFHCCCCNNDAISNTTISSLIRFSLLSTIVIVIVIVLVYFYHWYYHCHYCW